MGTMRDEGIGDAVIAEEGRPVGTVTDRDVALAIAEHGDVTDRDAEQLMTEDRRRSTRTPGPSNSRC